MLKIFLPPLFFPLRGFPQPPKIQAQTQFSVFSAIGDIL